MRKKTTRTLWGAGAIVVVAAIAAAMVAMPQANSQSEGAPPGPPPATPVSVAVVEEKPVTLWDEFSGRLEAVDSVDVRSRVAGEIQSVHFREGALVTKGDLLITIDPAPYAAEVARTEALVSAGEARVALAKSELERGRRLWDSRTIPQSDLDLRVNALSEAEANVKAAHAALQTAQLDLGYTQISAPVSGRVGKLEITVGNLVESGPGAPVLTRLVSVDPIYASFNADEEVVVRVLKGLADAGTPTEIERIPVEMATATSNGTVYRGHMQLIDNEVDIESGTVRVRAVFDNPDGILIPGQFARLRMGRATNESAVVVSERAVGADQDKQFVMVVGADNKAAYREVKLGATTEGLRIVTDGLKAGERVVVNGLQRIRPDSLVEPRIVPMLADAAGMPNDS
jgi:multidrug efflux system membrane fusion protein